MMKLDGIATFVARRSDRSAAAAGRPRFPALVGSMTLTVLSMRNIRRGRGDGVCTCRRAARAGRLSTRAERPRNPPPSERQPAHREGISEADAEGPLTGAAARPGHDW